MKFSSDTLQRLQDVVRSAERTTNMEFHRRSRWFATANDPLEIPFKPDAAVPAFGVMKIGDATVPDECIVNTTHAGPHGMGDRVLINNFAPVASGAIGAGAFGLVEPVQALYDSADGTPAAGEMWGPSPTVDWKLGKWWPGFRVLCVDPNVAGTVWVLRTMPEDYEIELTTSLTPGGIAQAELLSLNPTTCAYIHTGRIVTVFDACCEYFGSAHAAWGVAFRKWNTPDKPAVAGQITMQLRRLTCPTFGGCPA